MQINYQLIDTHAKLKHFCKELKKETSIAVDLEADSMYHYREKICLLQISTRGQNVLIDPLAIDDLSPLGPVFENSAIQKILHGADYDIRSLHRDYQFRINNLFDTQLASMFVGYRRTGLRAVVKKHFNIGLEKKFQKKDWSVRPLPKGMMRYAAMDTVHLIPLAEILMRELRQKDRLSWVEEECQYLSRVRPASNTGEPLFKRFKGAGRLDRQRLNTLEALLQLRDQIASQKDRPVFKILGNQALMRIARAQPTSRRQLARLNAISPKQTQMYADAIIQNVKQAMRTPPQKYPSFPLKKGPSISLHTHRRIDALKLWRDQKARRLELDPSLICNKALITAIAQERIDAPHDLNTIEMMHQWRIDAFGDEITQILKSV